MKQVIINNEITNYYITTDGRLYNSKTKNWYIGRVSESGYMDYILTINHKQHSYRAHRLVAESFIPNPNNLPIVNHKDGNKLNNTIDNLEWVTYSENTKHAVDNGLIKKTKSVRECFTHSLDGEQWALLFEDENYKISNYGRVLNLKTNIILKGKESGGYRRYELSLKTGKKNFLGHRLVYKAFNSDFDIFDSTQIINHKDGDKKNNKLDNLEKITKSENVLHSYYITKTNTNIRPVIQYDKNMNFIIRYDSANQASRCTNIKQSLITLACQRKGTSHGFNWRYEDS